MTDPTQPRLSALPLWALGLSVLGICFFPVLPIALVLGIIGIVRHRLPEYAPRLGFSIAALALSVLAVPITGILAAIAIPNFIKFQARSRMVACKSALQDALAAEKAFKAEHDRFTTHPAELGFTPDPKAPAKLLLRFDGVGPLSSPVGATSDAVGFVAPGAEGVDEGLSDEVRGQLGLHGACPDCSITLACAANLDNDPTLDVWSISSAPRPRAGADPVPAGTLFHHVDDVSEVALPLPPFGLPAATTPPVVQAPGAGPPVEDDPRGWQVYSFDGRTGLKQTGVGERCLLTCTREDGTRVWEQLAACQATKGERRFLAPDCGRLVVLVPAPNRGKPWSATEVMRVYQRGTLAYAVMGPTVVSEATMRANTTWLQGTYGAAGEEPRYAPDGKAVEYTTISGIKGSVSLVAEDAAPPPAEKATPAKKKAKKARP